MSVAGSGPLGASSRHPRRPPTASPTPATSLRGRLPHTSCQSSHQAAFGSTTPVAPAGARATAPPRRRPSDECRTGPSPGSGPAAPRCGGPGGPSAGHSHRSGRCGPPGAGPFFDAWPLGLEPRGDHLGVTLARDAAGFLRGEAPGAEPGAEIPRVELDAELLADQLRQARPSPQVGREPVLRRLVGQPSSDDLLLGSRQLGWPARCRAGVQTWPTLLPVCGDPPPDGPGVDAEELGDFLGGVPFQDALNGEAAAMFQVRW